MDVNKHHPARIVTNNSDWQKAIKCTIILKSFLAMVLLGSFSALAAEDKSAQPQTQIIKQASSGTASPCVPLTKMNMEKATARIQRNAGNPSLTPAMALSIALGLRTALGPMEKSAKPTGRSMPPAVKTAKSAPADTGRFALASGVTKGRCIDGVSSKATDVKLAMEH